LWHDTKKRLQKRLGYKEKDFTKIKIFFIPEGLFYANKLIALEDGLLNLQSISADEQMKSFTIV